MAHFARMNGNIVETVIVINNETLGNLEFPESESVGVEFCQSLYGSDTVWKQTSYNGNFRKNYAGLGYIYDPDLDAFIPPQPYPSWILNLKTCLWEAPTPMPQTNDLWFWNEETVSWIKG